MIHNLNIKRKLSLLLLYVYLLSLLQPITPVLSDFFAHVVNEKQHLATVHFENGRYHVHKELINSDKSFKSKQNPNKTLKSNKTVDHLITKKINFKTYSPPLKSETIKLVYLTKDPILKKDSPPPKA